MGVTLSYSGLGGKVKFSGTSGRFKTVYTKPLLLDLYPSATVAYSLRKLRTAYTGSAIRVRRSDFTETNIGFVNDVLDTASLLTFVGVNSGFVTTWYDQSGNASNAVQSAAGSQPIIVDSGVLVTENTKPSLNFTGRDMPLATIISSNTNLSMFAAQRTKTTTSNGIVLGHSSGGGSGPFFGISNNKYNINIAINGVSKNGASVADAGIAFNILNTIVNSVDAYPYINDTLIPITLSTWTPSTTDFTQIGKYFIFGSEMNLSELIVYKTDQTTSRSNITSNINSYYSIY